MMQSRGFDGWSVDGSEIRRSPVDMVNISYLQGFLHARWLQQYHLTLFLPAFYLFLKKLGVTRAKHVHVFFGKDAMCVIGNDDRACPNVGSSFRQDSCK